MTSPQRSLGCRRVQERLAELEDGALAPLAEARDRGHLEVCAACALELAWHRRLLARLRGLETIGAEEVTALSASVLACLPARPPSRPHLGVRSRASLVLASAAALLLAGLWTFRGLPRAPRPADLGALPSLAAGAPDWSGWLRGIGSLLRPSSSIGPS